MGNPEKSMTNAEVVKAWWWGREAKSGHLSTDGQSLWSYNLKIGGMKEAKRWPITSDLPVVLCRSLPLSTLGLPPDGPRW